MREIFYSLKMKPALTSCNKLIIVPRDSTITPDFYTNYMLLIKLIKYLLANFN